MFVVPYIGLRTLRDSNRKIKLGFSFKISYDLKVLDKIVQFGSDRVTSLGQGVPCKGVACDGGSY